MTKARTTRRPAATVPPEPTPRERILWLLGFLRRDADALRPGEWLDLQQDVQRHVWPQMDLREPTFNEAVREWHHELRRGLDELEAGGQWTFHPPLDRSLTHLRLQRHLDGWLLPVYERPTLRSALMTAAVDLVVHWWPQLRRCKRDSCRAWFLPKHGRQRYHEAACSFQARWNKFASTHKRDYHAEYAQRVKRVAPGAKPQRRARRKAV
jgi:hypothetical protein